MIDGNIFLFGYTFFTSTYSYHSNNFSKSTVHIYLCAYICACSTWYIDYLYGTVIFQKVAPGQCLEMWLSWALNILIDISSINFCMYEVK